MGNQSSKFQKHLLSGDEKLAINLFKNSTDIQKLLDPSLPLIDSYCHDTPLHIALRHGMPYFVQMFVNDSRCDISIKNDKSQSVLHALCEPSNFDSNYEYPSIDVEFTQDTTNRITETQKRILCCQILYNKLEELCSLHTKSYVSRLDETLNSNGVSIPKSQTSNDDNRDTDENFSLSNNEACTSSDYTDKLAKEKEPLLKISDTVTCKGNGDDFQQVDPENSNLKPGYDFYAPLLTSYYKTYNPWAPANFLCLKDTKGWTALHYVARAGNFALFKYLLERWGSQPLTRALVRTLRERVSYTSQDLYNNGGRNSFLGGGGIYEQHYYNRRNNISRVYASCLDLAWESGNERLVKYIEFHLVYMAEEQDDLIEKELSRLTFDECYKALARTDLQEVKDTLIVSTADMLNVPLFTAEGLLRAHDWSKSKLLKSWTCDSRACCQMSGVQSPPSSTTSPTNYYDKNSTLKNNCMFDSSTTSLQPTIMKQKPSPKCGICDEILTELGEQAQNVQDGAASYPTTSIAFNKDVRPDAKAKIVKPKMDCWHLFCRTCWETYLTLQIQEGKVNMILCPAYECNNLVPIAFIEKIVSRDLTKKYLQYDLQTFVTGNPYIRFCPVADCPQSVKIHESYIIPKDFSLSSSADRIHCWKMSTDPDNLEAANISNNALIFKHPDEDDITTSSDLYFNQIGACFKIDPGMHVYSIQIFDVDCGGNRVCNEYSNLPYMTDEYISNLTNFHEFCWLCGSEAHPPCSCTALREWNRKIMRACSSNEKSNNLPNTTKINLDLDKDLNKKSQISTSSTVNLPEENGDRGHKLNCKVAKTVNKRKSFANIARDIVAMSTNNGIIAHADDKTNQVKRSRKRLYERSKSLLPETLVLSHMSTSNNNFNRISTRLKTLRSNSAHNLWKFKNGISKRHGRKHQEKDEKNSFVLGEVNESQFSEKNQTNASKNIQDPKNPSSAENDFLTAEEAEQEYERVANKLWLATHCKPCPKCRCPIQKVEGCNHIRCYECKFDFCWVCLEAWRKHGTSTGGYFRCQRVEAVNRAKKNIDQTIERVKMHHARTSKLHTFLMHYNKYREHDTKLTFEQSRLLQSLLKRMARIQDFFDEYGSVLFTDFFTTSALPLLGLKKESIISKYHCKESLNLSFLLVGHRQLIKARRVCKYSAVYAYFMMTEIEEQISVKTVTNNGKSTVPNNWENNFGNHIKTSTPVNIFNKTIFDFLLNELEECTENLSKLLNCAYFSSSRMKILQMTHLVYRKRREFINSLDWDFNNFYRTINERKRNNAIGKTFVDQAMKDAYNGIAMIPQLVGKSDNNDKVDNVINIGLYQPQTPPMLKKFRRKHFPNLLDMETLRDDDNFRIRRNITDFLIYSRSIAQKDGGALHRNCLSTSLNKNRRRSLSAFSTFPRMHGGSLKQSLKYWLAKGVGGSNGFGSFTSFKSMSGANSEQRQKNTQRLLDPIQKDPISLLNILNFLDNSDINTYSIKELLDMACDMFAGNLTGENDTKSFGRMPPNNVGPNKVKNRLFYNNYLNSIANERHMNALYHRSHLNYINPSSLWVKDETGRHANLIALYDWPSPPEEEEEDELLESPKPEKTQPPVNDTHVGINASSIDTKTSQKCKRKSCAKQRVYNPRTGVKQEFCSFKCFSIHQQSTQHFFDAKNNSYNSSQFCSFEDDMEKGLEEIDHHTDETSEVLKDPNALENINKGNERRFLIQDTYHLDMIRALEMSRIEYQKEIKRREMTSNHNPQSCTSIIEKNNDTRPKSNLEICHADCNVNNISERSLPASMNVSVLNRPQSLEIKLNNIVAPMTDLRNNFCQFDVSIKFHSHQNSPNRAATNEVSNSEHNQIVPAPITEPYAFVKEKTNYGPNLYLPSSPDSDENDAEEVEKNNPVTVKEINSLILNKHTKKIRKQMSLIGENQPSTLIKSLDVNETSKISKLNTTSKSLDYSVDQNVRPPLTFNVAPLLPLQPPIEISEDSQVGIENTYIVQNDPTLPSCSTTYQNNDNEVDMIENVTTCLNSIMIKNDLSSV